MPKAADRMLHQHLVGARRKALFSKGPVSPAEVHYGAVKALGSVDELVG
jgi:hypothetical protein